MSRRWLRELAQAMADEGELEHAVVVTWSFFPVEKVYHFWSKCEDAQTRYDREWPQKRGLFWRLRMECRHQ